MFFTKILSTTTTCLGFRHNDAEILETKGFSNRDDADAFFNLLLSVHRHPSLQGRGNSMLVVIDDNNNVIKEKLVNHKIASGYFN